MIARRPRSGGDRLRATRTSGRSSRPRTSWRSSGSPRRERRRDHLAGRRLAGRRSPRAWRRSSAFRIRSTPRPRRSSRRSRGSASASPRRASRSRVRRSSERERPPVGPVRRQGSRPPGPARADRRAHARRSSPAAIEAALEASRSGVYIVEELVDGPEVTVNAVSIDGAFHPLAVADRLTAEPPRSASRWRTPGLVASKRQSRDRGGSRRRPRRSGSRNGPTYTQILVGRGRVRAWLSWPRGSAAATTRSSSRPRPASKLNDLALDFALGDERLLVSRHKVVATGARASASSSRRKGSCAPSRASGGRARRRGRAATCGSTASRASVRAVAAGRRTAPARDRRRRQPRRRAGACSRAAERNTLRRRDGRRRDDAARLPAARDRRGGDRGRRRDAPLRLADDRPACGAARGADGRLPRREARARGRVRHRGDAPRARRARRSAPATR